MAPRGFELSLIVARRDRTSAKVFLVLQRWTPSAHRQPTVSPPYTYSLVSHLPLLNILPSVSLFCPSHPVCEIIINPLVMAPRSRKSAQGRFFFFFSCTCARLCLLAEPRRGEKSISFQTRPADCGGTEPNHIHSVQ